MPGHLGNMIKDARIGIIGAGSMARQHLAVLRAVEGIQPVGIVSRTKSKAEDLAREYRTSCFDHVDDLIKEARPDALMVLVSEDQMFTVASAVIPYGLPLFIEKPPGLVPEEAQQLVRLADEYKVKTMVGFNRRYYSVFHKGLEVIRRHGPLLGVMVEGHERFWRVRNSGKFKPAVMDQWIYANSTHTIDLLHFFGGTIQDVTALARAYKEPRGDQFGALVAFASGTIGQYQAYWYSPGGWRVVLYGDGVTVEFKPLEQGRWTDTDFKTHDIEPNAEDVRFKPGFYRQMKMFGEMVREGKQPWPILDLAGAYETMRLAQRIASPDTLNKDMKNGAFLV